MEKSNISIHAPLAGSDDKVSNELRDLWISIHVPLVGSDGKAGRRCTVSTYFNPRSPCGERRLAATRPPTPKRFQSTFPLRGATSHSTHRHRPPAISIHVPLAGSDVSRSRMAVRCRYFNPRSPCGERRGEGVGDGERDLISIHAPLAGSDHQTFA